ncbi:MAG: hypothetical protein RQ930_04200 [Candidatus Aenigmarchaeota archaeon]|nr:hypothetical protein [Candidatus Aenigmarchaeota archaeon]
MRKLLSFFIFIVFLFRISFSQPILFDEQPKNGTYIYGRDTDVFSIRVSATTITSASLFAKVKDPTAIWKEIQMNCYNLNPWLCNTTIPGLEALLAEGKYLLYYFKVSDDSGTSYYGNESSPLEVLVDRSPPIISLASISAQNNSYVSERKKLIFNITDPLSGVNVNATVFLFAYGNETWNSSWINLIYQNDSFIAPWNTSELPNNSTWIVYVNASDMVGNWNATRVGIFHIDNEYPEILDYYPKDEQAIWGEYKIFVKARDLYSGLNRIEISIGGFNDSSSCEKDSCIYVLNTGKVPDGNYTLIITVFDNAENFASISVKVRIDNRNPVLTLEYPSDYLSGEVALKLLVGNVREIRNPKVQIYQPGATSESPLNCQNFVCIFLVDTKAYRDGTYTFVFSIQNEVGMETSLSKTFYFDNTKPILLVSNPVYENNTIFVSFGGMDDFGLNENSSLIEFLGNIYIVKCRKLVENKRILCEDKIEKRLDPGNYTIRFEIFDLANNSASEEKTLEVKPLIIPIEEKKTTENLTSTAEDARGNKISTPFGEFEPFQLALIFGVPIFTTLLVIPLYYLLGKNKTTSIKIEAEERLKNELDNVSLAERILNMSGELIEEKEYLLNVEKMIEEISQVSPLKSEFENTLRILPREIRKGLENEYWEKISKIEKRNVNEIKKRIEYALNLKDLEEIRKVKEEIRILLNSLRKNIEEELNLLQELKKSVGGVKIER